MCRRSNEMSRSIRTVSRLLISVCSVTQIILSVLLKETRLRFKKMSVSKSSWTALICAGECHIKLVAALSWPHMEESHKPYFNLKQALRTTHMQTTTSPFRWRILTRQGCHLLLHPRKSARLEGVKVNLRCRLKKNHRLELVQIHREAPINSTQGWLK